MSKLILVMVFTAGGCTTLTASFKKTGSFKAAVQPSNCEVTAYQSLGSGSYTEIGVIEFSHNVVAEQGRVLAAKIVCKNGGNGLLFFHSLDNALGRLNESQGLYSHARVVFVKKVR